MVGLAYYLSLEQVCVERSFLILISNIHYHVSSATINGVERCEWSNCPGNGEWIIAYEQLHAWPLLKFHTPSRFDHDGCQGAQWNMPVLYMSINGTILFASRKRIRSVHCNKIFKDHPSCCIIQKQKSDAFIIQRERSSGNHRNSSLFYFNVVVASTKLIKLSSSKNASMAYLMLMMLLNRS